MHAAGIRQGVRELESWRRAGYVIVHDARLNPPESGCILHSNIFMVISRVEPSCTADLSWGYGVLGVFELCRGNLQRRIAAPGEHVNSFARTASVEILF